MSGLPSLGLLSLLDSSRKLLFYIQRLTKFHLLIFRDEDSAEPHGHVTSNSVFRAHRRLGLANELMRQSQIDAALVYRAEHCNLPVRKTNRAAIRLHRKSL